LVADADLLDRLVGTVRHPNRCAGRETTALANALYVADLARLADALRHYGLLDGADDLAADVPAAAVVHVAVGPHPAADLVGGAEAQRVAPPSEEVAAVVQPVLAVVPVPGVEAERVAHPERVVQREEVQVQARPEAARVFGEEPPRRRVVGMMLS